MERNTFLMPDYKNTNRFKKPFTRSGPSSRFSSDGPKQMFKAECSKCHRSCDVPFKPNGKKPVFCSACFVRDDEGDSRGDSRGSYQKNEYRSERPSFSPKPVQQEDPRIGDIKRQLSAVDEKLEMLIQMFEASRAVAPKENKEEVPVKAKKVAPKKVAKKK